MLSKIVGVIGVLIGLSVTLTCSQTTDYRNAPSGNRVMFYQPPKNQVRVTTRSSDTPLNNEESAPAVSQQSLTTTTTSSPDIQTTTQIDDRDYWDNDDFQPYKVDTRDYFDWRLLEEIFTKQKTNVIISPFSVKFALALLYEAAGESATKKELAQVFFQINSPILLQETYKEMLDSLKIRGANYTLNFATKMYLPNNLQPRPLYQRTLKDIYDTDIENLNFSQAEEAADIINSWCRNITEGHLTNLVTSDNIQNAGLLLINAIYFDGKWRTPFTETYESVFFRQPSEQIRTEYMTITDKFYYFFSSIYNTQVLRLPYKGKKFSMTIFLPASKGGLEQLIHEMEGDGLRRIQWLMTEQTVKVTMPKFKFDHTTQLKETLMALGVNEIFTDAASLGGVLRGSSLTRKMKVTNIIQKAGIEVHETGSTAYAATEVEIVNKFGGDSLTEFLVNRPFMFIINDESTSNMIFAGKVLDPSA